MKLSRCFLIPVLLLCGYISNGQAVVTISKETDNVILNPHALLYKDDKASIMAIQAVSTAPDRAFIKNPHFQEIDYGFRQPQGWCKFSVKNLSYKSQWILKVHEARVDSVQLYVQRGQSAPEKYPLTGHFQNIQLRPFSSLHFAYQVTIPQNETVTFYLYTEREFGRHSIILDLLQESYYRNYEHIFMSGISFICGMIILATLVGLVLFFFVLDRIYLYYSIYCLIFFILILSDTGYVHGYISTPGYQSVANTYNTIFYYLIVGWHILFTIILLNTRKHYTFVYWFGYILGLVLCAVAFALMIPGLWYPIRWWLIYFSYYIVFFFDAYILFVLIIGVIKKEPAVYFYLAGFLVTVVVASLLVLADLQILDGINQNTDLYFSIPLIEILFMVLGLGFRFSATLKEKYKVQVALNATQNQIITIQEDERRRIAQDLHDDVGNSLAAIKIMLVQKRDNKLIEKEIDHIIEDVRGISHNLMPIDFQEYSLATIMKNTIHKLAGHPTINFEYDCTGEVIKMSPLTELVIYRIINELITNIIKHSNATTALVQLIYQQEGLVVTVEDNGVGLGKPSEYEDGLGLKSIELRAQYIKAKLNIESDSKGTLVILETPYENT